MIKNKRGFTLIEVIIAISIFTIVIGVGYNVLNKTNDSMEQQQVITDGQMNANLVNKYLTKDLEACRSLIKPNNTTVDEYEYTIKKDKLLTPSTDDIKYKVMKLSRNSKSYYNVDRITSSSSIRIISNQLTTLQAPFVIGSNLINKNIYEVALDYNIGETIKSYKFNVAPRFLEASISGGDDGSTTADNIGDIRFGYDDQYIWTKIDPKKNGAQNTTDSPKDFIPNQPYDINVFIDRQNAKSYTEILGENIYSKATSNDNFFKDKDFDTIKFGIKEDLYTDLTVEIRYKGKSDPLVIKLKKQDGKEILEILQDPIKVVDTKIVTDTTSTGSTTATSSTVYKVYSMPSYYSQKQQSITIKGTIKKTGNISYSSQEQLIIQLGKGLDLKGII